jgi:hypothetical protein
VRNGLGTRRGEKEGGVGNIREKADEKRERKKVS